MKKYISVLIIFVLFSCGNTENKIDSNTDLLTYECESFTFNYPSSYHLVEDLDVSDTNFKMVCLTPSKDDPYNIYQIEWANGYKFPMTLEEVVLVMTKNDIDGSEALGASHTIIHTDSVYTIDGYKTFNISSVIINEEDTVIQTRCALSATGNSEVVITQRVKAVESNMKYIDDFNNINSSIKFK